MSEKHDSIPWVSFAASFFDRCLIVLIWVKPKAATNLDGFTNFRAPDQNRKNFSGGLDI